MKTLATLNRPSWLPSSAWPWPTYALSHDGGSIAVTDIGHGPTLLFGHVGSWSFVWRDVLRCLHTDVRCGAIDAPGSGLSERGPAPPTLAQAGDAITAATHGLPGTDGTLPAPR